MICFNHKQVQHNQKKGVSPIVQQVREPVQLEGIMDAVVPLTGATIKLLGSGFRDGMKVFMDSTELKEVLVLDPKQAMAQIPPVAVSGVHDISVRNPDGCSSTLKGVLYCVSSAPSESQFAPPSRPRTTSPVPVIHQTTISAQPPSQQPQPTGPAVVVDSFETTNPHSRKWG